jgi:hypothetical protein
MAKANEATKPEAEATKPEAEVQPEVQPEAEATKPEEKEEKKAKRSRKQYWFGETRPLTDYGEPPEDGWESASLDGFLLLEHRLPTDEDFADSLHYWQFCQWWAEQLGEYAGRKVKELQQFGSARTRKQAAAISGTAEQLVSQLLGAMQDSSIPEEERALFSAQVAAMLGQVVAPTADSGDEVSD